MNKCAWCGAAARWYDDVCPRCGKKLPTLTPPPIELPNFDALTPTPKSDARTAVSPAPFPTEFAPTFEPPIPEFVPAPEPQIVEPEPEPKIAEPQPQPEPEIVKPEPQPEPEILEPEPEPQPEPKIAEPAPEPEPQIVEPEPEPKSAEPEPTSASKKKPKAQKNAPKAKPKAQKNAPKAKPKAQKNAPQPKRREKAPAKPPKKKAVAVKAPRPSRVRRLFADFAANWRAYREFRFESVVFPPRKARRYVLWFAIDAIICFPCAIWGARFFLRAFAREKNGDFSEALRDAERARFALALGWVFFAAVLCAFVYYVAATNARPEISVPDATFFSY